MVKKVSPHHSPEFKFRFVFFRLQMLRFSTLCGPNEQKFGEILTWLKVITPSKFFPNLSTESWLTQHLKGKNTNLNLNSGLWSSPVILLWANVFWPHFPLPSRNRQTASGKGGISTAGRWIGSKPTSKAVLPTPDSSSALWLPQITNFFWTWGPNKSSVNGLLMNCPLKKGLM